MMKSFLIAAFGTLALAGCMPEKAPKMCVDFAHQEKCDAKEHCMWADGSCKAK